jgi:hypothetical protein
MRVVTVDRLRALRHFLISHLFIFPYGV